MILAYFAALAAQPGVGGHYRSRTMEVGAALELLPDGRFRYQLDYGAVSEGAEGRWTIRDGVLYLTSTRFAGAWKEHTFKDEPLPIDQGDLLLRRYGRVIRFEREEPANR